MNNFQVKSHVVKPRGYSLPMRIYSSENAILIKIVWIGLDVLFWFGCLFGFLFLFWGVGFLGGFFVLFFCIKRTVHALGKLSHLARSVFPVGRTSTTQGINVYAAHCTIRSLISRILTPQSSFYERHFKLT